MVRHAATEGVTFPADTLPRVAGAEIVVVCPACATEWKPDSHDRCPTCGLMPQGMN
jgi:rubrerythrin